MRILTHSGKFHADEVFAIAALVKWRNISISDVIRTRDIPTTIEAMKDSNTYVIDTGGVYNKAKLNFDHHQDLSLSASNVLVYWHLMEIGKIEIDCVSHLYKFMKGISFMDTNQAKFLDKWNGFNNQNLFRNINSMITNFNRDIMNPTEQDFQFAKAVVFAVEILENEIQAAKRDNYQKFLFMNRTVIGNNIAIFDEPCNVWSKHHKYAIMPNELNNWQIVAKNKNLPEIVHKDLVFQHKANFIAVFNTKEAAIEVALTLK